MAVAFSALLLSAVGIVFPQEGMKLPAITNVYAIGSVDAGVSNVVINGEDVAVHPSGAWATLVAVKPGENTLNVEGITRTFTVAQPKPKANATDAAKPTQEKKYTKLEYAADAPIDHPAGRDPQMVTIVIDAGHGGKDTGALSPHGYCEKDANLKLAQEVMRELMARGYKVVMTREDDKAIQLYDRPKVAHKAGASAFVSIHHNAPPYDRDPRRFRYHTIYCWNDIGERLAQAVNKRMGESFGAALKNNGVQRANYAVMRNPEIPSCLIEVDFVTSPEGEASIWDSSRRALTAAAIAEGIADWSNQK